MFGANVDIFPPELNLYRHAKQHERDMLSITPQKLRLKEQVVNESGRIEEMMSYISKTADKEMYRNPISENEERQLARCLFGGIEGALSTTCEEKSINFDRVAYDIYDESFGRPVFVTRVRKMNGTKATKTKIEARIKEEGPLSSIELQRLENSKTKGRRYQFLALEDASTYEKEMKIFAKRQKIVKQINFKTISFHELKMHMMNGAVTLDENQDYPHPCTIIVSFEFTGARLQENAGHLMTVFVHPELSPFIDRVDQSWIEELSNEKKISVSRQLKRIVTDQTPKRFESLREANIKGFSELVNATHDAESMKKLQNLIAQVQQITKRFPISGFLKSVNRGSTFQTNRTKFVWVQLSDVGMELFVNPKTREPYVPVKDSSDYFLYPVYALSENSDTEYSSFDDETLMLQGEYLLSDVEQNQELFSSKAKEGWSKVSLYVYRDILPSFHLLPTNYAPYNQEHILLYLLSRQQRNGRISLPFPRDLVYKINEGNTLEFPKGTNQSASIVSLGNFGKSWLGNLLPKSLAGEYYNRILTLRLEKHNIVEIQMYGSQEVVNRLRQENRILSYDDLRTILSFVRGELYTFDYESENGKRYVPVKVQVKGQEVIGTSMFFDPSLSPIGAASITLTGLLGTSEGIGRILDKFNLGEAYRNRSNSRALLIKLVSALTGVLDLHLISRLIPLDENAKLNDSLLVRMFEALKDADLVNKLRGFDVVSFYGFSLGAAQSTLAALLVELSRRVLEVSHNRIIALSTAFFVGGSPRVVDHHGNAMLETLFDHNRVKVNGQSKRSFHMISSVIRRSPSLCFQIIPDPYSCITNAANLEVTKPGFLITQSIPTEYTRYFTKGSPLAQVRGYHVPEWLERNHPSGVQNKVGKRFIERILKGNIEKIKDWQFMPYIFPFRLQGSSPATGLFHGVNKIQLDIGSLIKDEFGSWVQQYGLSWVRGGFTREQTHLLNAYGSGFISLHAIDVYKRMIENPTALIMGDGAPSLPDPIQAKLDNGLVLTDPNLTNHYAFTYIRRSVKSEKTVDVLQWPIDFWDEPRNFREFFTWNEADDTIIQLNQKNSEYFNPSENATFAKLLRADYTSPCDYARDNGSVEEEEEENNASRKRRPKNDSDSDEEVGRAKRRRN